MLAIKILSASELSEKEKSEICSLILMDFTFFFTNNKFRLHKLFLDSINFSQVYVAIFEKKIVGAIAYSTYKKKAFTFDKTSLCKKMGVLGGSFIYRHVNKQTVYNSSSIYIDYIITNPNYRGNGIASELIKYIYKLLEYGEYFLDVSSRNRKAIQLYKKMGFEKISTRYNFLLLIIGIGRTHKLRYLKK